MQRTLLRAVTVAACTLALAAPISAAQAETQSHKDPRGDVSSDRTKLAAREPGIDIRRVVNTFESDTLKMRVKIPNRARDLNISWSIKTGQGQYGVSIDRFAGINQLSFYSFNRKPGSGGDGVVIFSKPLAGQVRTNCRGVGQRTRGASIIVTVDRSCIADATRVRVATTTARFERRKFKIDDAWQKGFNLRRGRAEFGPRLHLN